MFFLYMTYIPETLEELREYVKKHDINNIDESNSDHYTTFQLICKNKYTSMEMLQLCLESGGNLNIQDMYGCTPFSALCYGSYENKFDLCMLKLCIKYGGNLNLTDVKGETTPFNKLCYHLVKDRHKILKYISRHKLVNDITLQLNITYFRPGEYEKYFMKKKVVEINTPGIIIL